MSLKIAVKPLKGETFEVEIAGDAKVSDLKKLIAQTKSEYHADGQKLIHVGRILKDEDTVESIGIKAGEFLVVMVTKAKAPATAAPTAAPSSTPAPAPADGGGAAEQAAAAVVSGEGIEAAVTQLMDMGFPQAEVERCLQAAFGNPDRAVEYLMNGIPEAITREAAGPPPAAAGGAPGGGAAPVAGGTPPSPAGGAAPGAVPIPPELLAIRGNPQFTQLAGVIAQNPQVIAQLLPALQQSHPEIAQAIMRHPQAFLQMVAEVAGGGGDDPVAAMLAAAQGGGGGARPGQTVVRLSEDERAAVERLCQLGFDRDMAIQAYLACDKNEELAANFLFDNAGDDMQD